MKKQLISMAAALTVLTACGRSAQSTVEADKFDYTVEQFADLQILRYRVPDFEQLSLKQKELVYYLTEAALQGRDILFDQNGKYNLRIRRALEARGSDGSGIGSGFEVVFIEIIRNFVNDVRVDGITLDKMGDRSGENGDFGSGICLCGVSDDGVDGSEIAFFGIDSHGFQGIGDGIVGFAEDELLHVSLEIGKIIGVIVFSITRSPNGREVVDIFARGTDLKGKSFVVAVEGHLDGDTVLISPTFILDPAIGDISHDIRMDAVGEIVSVFVFNVQSRKRIAENIGGDIRIFGRRGGRSRGSARLDEIRRGTERATGKGREREEGNN